MRQIILSQQENAKINKLKISLTKNIICNMSKNKRLVVEMKNRDNASRKIVEYIKKNNISIAQIEKDTGVSGKKIADDGAVFLASEFLELCSYLNLNPKEL